MARFHLDHNVSHEVAEILQLRGHDVLTAWDLGLITADDDVHLSTAADDTRILVTHNKKDFLLLHKAWRRWPLVWVVAVTRAGGNVPPGALTHAGVVIIPQQPHLRSVDAALAVDSLVRDSFVRGRMLTNEFYYPENSGAAASAGMA